MEGNLQVAGGLWEPAVVYWVGGTNCGQLHSQRPLQTAHLNFKSPEMCKTNIVGLLLRAKTQSGGKPKV